MSTAAALGSGSDTAPIAPAESNDAINTFFMNIVVSLRVN
jgi:hypothetical protein